jgi:hypothetical protein
MMAMGQGEHMPGHHRSPHGADHSAAKHLDELEMATLRQLDDTRFLAMGRLDCAACDRLARLGLVFREADDYWKITPDGRRLVRGKEAGRTPIYYPGPLSGR